MEPDLKGGATINLMTFKTTFPNISSKKSSFLPKLDPKYETINPNQVDIRILTHKKRHGLCTPKKLDWGKRSPSQLS